MDLIFLHGLPGVGKLTVAKELAQLSGYKLFHNHLTVDLVGSVFEFGTEPFVELREEVWYSVFRHAVKENISGLIFTFVFEKTVRDSFVLDVVDIVTVDDGTVHFIGLTCDTHILDKRVVDVSRQRYGKLTSVDMLHQLMNEGAFEVPEVPELNFVIDNTHQTPLETAQLIWEKVKKNRG